MVRVINPTCNALTSLLTLTSSRRSRAYCQVRSSRTQAPAGKARLTIKWRVNSAIRVVAEANYTFNFVNSRLISRLKQTLDPMTMLMTI